METMQHQFKQSEINYWAGKWGQTSEPGSEPHIRGTGLMTEWALQIRGEKDGILTDDVGTTGCLHDKYDIRPPTSHHTQKSVWSELNM